MMRLAENKKYYWIKLKTDYFDSDVIDWLMSQKNGSDYVVLYLMLCLKTANKDGTLSTQIGEVIVPYDIDKIVRDTKYFSDDTVRVALELYKKLGLIYEDNNGCLTISNFNNMIGSESTWAEKKRNYREKQKLLGHSQGQKEDNVLDNVRQEIEIDKEIDIDIDKEKEIEKELDKESFLFELASYTKNSTLQNSLKDFFEMLDKKGIDMKQNNVESILNKLDSISCDDEEKIKIVNKSIEKKWNSFYPLKKENKETEKKAYPDWWNYEEKPKTNESEAKRIKAALKATDLQYQHGIITDDEYQEKINNLNAMYRDITGEDLC